MSNVALITADYPGIISGIGDYAFLLQNHLQKIDVVTRIITSKNEKIKSSTDSLNIDWNLWAIKKIIQFLKKNDITIVIVQYPGSSYGRYSIIPHLFVIISRIFGFKIITTLHEYSNVVFLRRVSEWVFILFSQQIVMTSEYEKKNIGNLFNIQKKINIIQIGSNIQMSGSKSNYGSDRIVTFGMFYPDKKLENVIEFMKEIEMRYPNKYTLRFVGGCHIHFMNYFEEIKQKANNEIKRVEWFINNPLTTLPELIKDAFLALQYYNDGVSMRRGSFISIVQNGIPVITNRGEHTQELQLLEGNGVFYSNSTDNVFSHIDRLISNKQYYDDCANNLRKNCKGIGFDKIALKYKNVVENISKKI